jgi:hypothetical protein
VDYAYARRRARLSDPKSYNRVDLSKRLQNERRLLAQAFHEHADRWKDETAHLSSESKAIAHPSYLRIIGLSRKSTGNELERLILNELESEPDIWFAALKAVTGEDPVKQEHDFDESVEAWLAWGRDKGIIEN